MNSELTNQIVKHIFKNLGIIDQRHTSLISDPFLTNLVIEYEDIEGKPNTSKVWAAEATINNVKIQLMTSKFNMGTDEFAATIEIENCPAYGCYLEYYEADLEKQVLGTNINCLVAFSIKDDVWIPADIYTQATFLAGMEQLKDLTVSFETCKNPKPLYNKLIGFVNFRDDMQ